MPAKLLYKLCPFCGDKIFGKKRLDRGGYHYSPRCTKCARKALTPEVLALKQRLLNEYRQHVPVGTKRICKRGTKQYILIKIAEPRVWVYEHRWVTNAPPGMHVHHINGDTFDNRPVNLQIIDPSDHSKHHNTLHGKWSKHFDYCRCCKSAERKHLALGFCTRCYQRDDRDQTEAVSGA